jgi:hypothetical protein
MKKPFTKMVISSTARPQLVHPPAEPARMTLPDDLRHGICEWFDELYQKAYDEHLECMVMEAMLTPDYNPDDLPENEMRRLAVEYVEPDDVIRSMMQVCEQSKLECAIIEALFEEKGFVKCVRQHTSCTWERLYQPSPKQPKRRQIGKKRKAAE